VANRANDKRKKRTINVTRFMHDAGSDAVKPHGGKSQAHILKAPVDADCFAAMVWSR
jgi:hypothetical protein